MGFFLEWLVGAIVWTVANVIYVDLRRKGAQRGRVISFIAGWPGTLISMVAVREVTALTIEPPPDDEERLLREVRVDRELRLDEGPQESHRDDPALDRADRSGSGPEEPEAPPRD